MTLTLRLITCLLFGWITGAHGAPQVKKVCDLPAGSDCEARLLIAADGTMYGTTRAGGDFAKGSIVKATSSGTFNNLHSFNGIDGSDLRAGLVQDDAGNLYGTTSTGGLFGKGTVFKWDGENLTTLHSFNGADGDGPRGGLTQRGEGIFYGTTYSGGEFRAGTVFKLTGSGDFGLVYSFGPTFIYDYNYIGGLRGDLLLGSDGNLYGAVEYGEALVRGGLFSIDLADQYKLLTKFYYHDGGERPNGSLMQTSDGKIFGTSQWGSPNGRGGFGDLFTFDPATGKYRIIRGFGTGTSPVNAFPGLFVPKDGVRPMDGLSDGGDGDLYGTTAFGGENGMGTLFQYDYQLGNDVDGRSPFAAHSYTRSYSFDGTIGSVPMAALAKGPTGDLFGSTSVGGENNGGTIFRLRPNRRPVLKPDVIYVVPGEPFSADVLANDFDPDGDELQAYDPWGRLSSSPGGISGLGPQATRAYDYLVTDGYDSVIGSLEVRPRSPTFTPVAGNFVATISNTGGTLRFFERADGTIHGMFSLATAHVNFHGTFDSTGNFLTSFTAGGEVWSLHLQAHDRPGPQSITVIMIHGSIGELVPATEVEVMWPATYTFLVQSPDATSPRMNGDGFMLLHIDEFGIGRLRGRMPDGTPFIQSVEVPMNAPLSIYFSHKHWNVVGTISFSTDASSGTLNWQQITPSSDTTTELHVTGSRYFAPRENDLPLKLAKFGRATFEFDGGGLIGALVEPLLLRPRGALASGNGVMV
ncbi:MAG: hypothetical protein QOD99_640, partial [Chthoniobacter sp.]|nr:hypothetical protein [Chthoniobacter sp.]